LRYTPEVHGVLNIHLNAITNNSTCNYFINNNTIYTGLKNIHTTKFSGDVYDLSIEDNHNYLTHMGLVHNSGKRNGSIAVYLEPHHPEIMDFLQLRKIMGMNMKEQEIYFRFMDI